jgi:hypothetical protein
MTTYAVSSRFWNLFWLVVTLIPTIGIWGRLLALAASGRWRDEPTGGLIGSAIGGVVFLLASAAMAWRIHEVRITGSGRIEIARTIITTRFDTREIRQLEGKFHRGYDNEEEWKLHISYAGGKATIDDFHNVRDFVDRIEAINPMVQITGIWPMGAPEAPSRAGGVLP